jgi:hypothetical protein
MLRTFVTFDANFPDDGVFDGAGEIQLPSGRNVGEAIAQLLQSAGYEVTELAQRGFYGWQFKATAGSQSFLFVLQYPGPWLLLSQRVESVLEKLRSHPDDGTQRSVLQRLSAMLGEDDRFGRQSWFTKEEYENDSNRHRHDKP